MQQWRYDELTIVGYYDVVGIEHAPCPVQPIYAGTKELGLVVMPPYEEREGFLYGYSTDREELNILVAEQEATLLETSIKPQAGRQLWVLTPDEPPFYGTEDAIKQRVRELEKHWFQEAVSCLVGQSNFSRAKQLLWCTIRANPDSLLPYLIIRVLLKKEGFDEYAHILAGEIKSKFREDKIIGPLSYVADLPDILQETLIYEIARLAQVEDGQAAPPAPEIPIITPPTIKELQASSRSGLFIDYEDRERAVSVSLETGDVAFMEGVGPGRFHSTVLLGSTIRSFHLRRDGDIYTLSIIFGTDRLVEHKIGVTKDLRSAVRWVKAANALYQVTSEPLSTTILNALIASIRAPFVSGQQLKVKLKHAWILAQDPVQTIMYGTTTLALAGVILQTLISIVHWCGYSILPEKAFEGLIGAAWIIYGFMLILLLHSFWSSSVLSRPIGILIMGESVFGLVGGVVLAVLIRLTKITWSNELWKVFYPTLRFGAIVLLVLYFAAPFVKWLIRRGMSSSEREAGPGEFVPREFHSPDNRWGVIGSIFLAAGCLVYGRLPSLAATVEEAGILQVILLALGLGSILTLMFTIIYYPLWNRSICSMITGVKLAVILNRWGLLALLAAGYIAVIVLGNVIQNQFGMMGEWIGQVIELLTFISTMLVSTAVIFIEGALLKLRPFPFLKGISVTITWISGSGGVTATWGYFSKIPYATLVGEVSIVVAFFAMLYQVYKCRQNGRRDVSDKQRPAPLHMRILRNLPLYIEKSLVENCLSWVGDENEIWRNIKEMQDNNLLAIMPIGEREYLRVTIEGIGELTR